MSDEKYVPSQPVISVKTGTTSNVITGADSTVISVPYNMITGSTIPPIGVTVQYLTPEIEDIDPEVLEQYVKDYFENIFGKEAIVGSIKPVPEPPKKEPEELKVPSIKEMSSNRKLKLPKKDK